MFSYYIAAREVSKGININTRLSQCLTHTRTLRRFNIQYLLQMIEANCSLEYRKYKQWRQYLFCPQ